MATSFDDAFGPDFLSGLGSDNPQQNIIQGLNPPVAGDPATQPQGPVSFDASNMPATYGGIDTSPPAGEQQNVMQQIAQQAGPGQPSALGQVQMPAPTQDQPRGRMSLIDVIGKLGNVLANAHTGAPQYQTPLQQAQALQLAQQQVDAGQLGNQEKAQDLAQTNVATMQNANQVVGGFARGLQSLQAAGSNLDIAAPALARQMGIPENQAAEILTQAKADPHFLGTLADAADAQKPGAGAKFANQPLYTKDAQGNIHVNQLSNQGGLQEAVLPTGQTVIVPGITDVSTGGKNVILDRFGHPITAYTKSSAPGEDEGQVGTDANGNPIYNPLPGSLKAAQTTKTNLANDALVAKNKAALASSQASWDAAQAHIKNLNSAVGTLASSNSQPSTGTNAIGNAINYLQGSTAGQALSHVTNPAVAQARDQIKQDAQGLLVAAAHGQGQLFRNKQEQTNFISMINNPQSSIPVMRQAIRTLQMQMGPRPGESAPQASPSALPAPRPKLTPTYKVVNW